MAGETAPPLADAPLVVSGLACRLAGRRVFHGAGFRVEPGEAAVLRGPNGSGKSSLIRVLAGLCPAEAGEARFGSILLTRDAEAWRERIALAGHLDAVKPALSVRANLETWARLHGRPAAAVGVALERFGLTAIAEDPAYWCSAGQKRRLGLARLLVTARPIWLLDEPTVSLDARNVAVFAEAVAEHCAAGGIALAATHVDLGLTEGPVISMTDFPLEAEDAPAPPPDDPFLAEGWR